MLVAGGGLAAVLTFVTPHFANGKAASTLTVASVAIVVGTLCVLRPARVPAWALPLLPPFGTVLIGASTLMSHSVTDGSQLLYMWPVLLSAYFMTTRLAVVNVGLIALVYTPLAMSTLGKGGIAPSAYLVGTSVVTVLIVGNLRGHIARLLAAAAREARTDGLTGLANRRSWDEALAVELARAARRAEPLSLLMVDLDHFKRLNDTAGHAAGDAALVTVARVLAAEVREGDALARVGGEEFAVLLPGCGLADGYATAERIRTAVERSPVPVTVSLGVAAAPEHAATPAELSAAADAALYAAKDAGRNRIRVADDHSGSQRGVRRAEPERS